MGTHNLTTPLDARSFFFSERSASARGRRGFRLLAGVLAAGLVLAGSLFAVSPANAASAPACSQTGAIVTCTVTFTYTGAEQQFTVPANITSLSAVAIGAHGGTHQRPGISNNVGGNGASVSQSFGVTAGQTLFVEVGGDGSDWATAQSAPGGFNGGGTAPSYFSGTAFDLGAGAGGGASDVRTVASSAPSTLDSRLVVAAGGGGGSIQGNGGNAGSDGGPNAYSSFGHAGTAVAGGAAGSGGGSTGVAGTVGSGGAGGSNDGGAGGGGGLYGGGGAATYGAGGGGSSLGTVNGISSAPASVALSYSPAISDLSIDSSAASVTAGGTATFTAAGSDADGDTWSATASTTFTSSNPSDRVTGNTIRFGTSGNRTITGTDNSATATTPVGVTIGPASAITVARSAASVVAGGTATFTATSQDAGGDQLGDVTSSTTFTSSDPSDTVTSNSIQFGVSGSRTITAHEAGFTDTTTVAVTVGPQAKLTVTSSTATATAGDTATLTATAQDAGGDELGNVTSRTTFTSSNSSDSISGANITFGTAGLRTITGHRGAFTDTTSVDVVTGPISYILVTPSASQVIAGDSATFSAEGYDVSGDDLGNVTADTTFSSSDPSDYVTGSSIAFGTSGPRTITATDGSAVGTATETVNVGPVAYLALTAASSPVVAGGTTTIQAEGFDSAGDDLGDFTAHTTFSSSEPSDQVTGNTIIFGTTGARSIDGNDGGALGETSVTVIAGPVSSLVLTSSASDAPAGSSATITAEGFDTVGDDLGDVTADTTFSSSNGSDVVTGDSLAFGTAGSRTITGTDGTATGTTHVNVTVGSVATLVITSAPTFVGAGGSAGFSAEGLDSAGDDLGDVSANTTFTSDDSTDVVTGASIAFTNPGVRTITGTDGAATGNTTFTVTVGTLATLAITPASTNVVAGDSQAFTVEGFDAEHNSIGDVTNLTTFTGSAGADTVTGNVIRFTTAGTDTVTATAGDVSTTARVDVAADAANPGKILLHVSDATVARGASITLNVTGTDGYGNAIPGLTDRATFTSDWAVDVIHGATVTFPHASIHHITATLDGLRSTVTVTVTAPATSSLAFTGIDPTISLAGGLSAILIGFLAFYFGAVRRGAGLLSNRSRKLR
jgi:hypothetical protein